MKVELYNEKSMKCMVRGIKIGGTLHPTVSQLKGGIYVKVQSGPNFDHVRWSTLFSSYV